MGSARCKRKVKRAPVTWAYRSDGSKGEVKVGFCPGGMPHAREKNAQASMNVVNGKGKEEAKGNAQEKGDGKAKENAKHGVPPGAVTLQPRTGSITGATRATKARKVRARITDRPGFCPV